MIQVHVPNFFFGAEIQKMTEIDPKNHLFYQKMELILHEGGKPNTVLLLCGGFYRHPRRAIGLPGKL